MSIIIWICMLCSGFESLNLSPVPSHLDSFYWNYLFHALKGVSSHPDIPVYRHPAGTRPFGRQEAAIYSHPVQCAAGPSSDVHSAFLQSILFHPWLCNQIALWYNFVPHIIHSNIFQFSLTAQYVKISNHIFHLFSLIYKCSLKIIGSLKSNVKLRFKYGNNFT